MAFFRKKKQLRDREAGLVFRWRGTRKHHLGKFIAFLFATILFGLVVYGVKVDGLKPPLASKRTGSVILLDPESTATRRLMFQIEQKSPFPARWDPAHDEEGEERVLAMLDAAIGGEMKYEAELASVPLGLGRDISLASIVDSRFGLLSEMPYGWQPKVAAADVAGRGILEVRAEVVVAGDLEQRELVDVWGLPEELVAEDWYGQSFRFMVGVDMRGIVRHCVALPGGTMGVVKAGNRQKDLGLWLRSQRFKPHSSGKTDGEGLTFGEIELQIRTVIK